MVHASIGAEQRRTWFALGCRRPPSPVPSSPDGGAPPRSPPPLPAAVPLSWAPPLPAEREELRAATAATAREIPLLVTLSFSEDGAQARTAHASSRRGRC
ncbi:hypothetical protein SETIT_9G394800v2 [Setaria italica]|uniref:Uncharacterized protein n=1 Tax=Setaria italica TaxID=4555 RepID=A0A368SQJ4_SETIT|nr:hypothetical protein SETIT_9G394800v2 [Setaria italica]